MLKKIEKTHTKNPKIQKLLNGQKIINLKKSEKIYKKKSLKNPKNPRKIQKKSKKKIKKKKS